VIFVDTSAWFALMDRSCIEHSVAWQVADNAQAPLITTDYVLAESVTLLRARGLHEQAIELGERLFSQRLARLIWVTQEDVHKAWVFFRCQRAAGF
jgi:predicted nucleic acid-binding protein